MRAALQRFQSAVMWCTLAHATHLAASLVAGPHLHNFCLVSVAAEDVRQKNELARPAAGCTPHAAATWSTFRLPVAQTHLELSAE